MGRRIVPRSEWGARAPKSRHRIAPTPRLWLHHFATDGWRGAAGMRECQRFHMDSRGWNDIAYSFCVDNQTGTIYEGRGALVAGGHTQNDNSKSHAICVMANCETTPMSAAARDSVAWLVRHGFEQGWWLTPTLTGGHRDAQARGYSPKNGTLCAGKHAQSLIPEINRLATEDEDMPLTDDDVKRVADAVWSRTLEDSRVGMKAPAPLVMGDIWHHARVGARTGVNPSELAAELAPLVKVEGGGVVSQADLEAALRTVLGSLDD